MSRKVYAAAICIILFFGRTIAGQEEPSFFKENITISMDFQDASLKDILKVFSIQSGLNFIASETLQDRKVTLLLDKVPLKDALDRLFEANNLSYEYDKKANIIMVRDWGAPEVYTVTKVFYLKYAAVSSSRLEKERADSLSSGGSGSAGGEDTGITSVIKKLLSANGSVVEDIRTNSLIITDIPSHIPKITETITALDVPVPQVVLEVEMLDVSKSVIDEFGVRFPQSLMKLDMTTAARFTDFPFGRLAKKLDLSGAMMEEKETAGGWTVPAWSGTHFGPSVFSVINTQLTLDYLRTKTDTKILARPKILTMNNETAEIKITTQEAVGEKLSTSGGTSGVSTTTSEAERYETGISLRVTPQINLETGDITMFVVPSVSEAAASTITSSTGVRFYNPEVRATKSVVKIKDGETVILGGLIRHKRTETIVKLPILGDIPLLGYLFKHVERSPNEERELLVFITPHIIKENKVDLARANKLVIPEREQGQPLGSGRRQEAINNLLDTVDKKKSE